MLLPGGARQATALQLEPTVSSERLTSLTLPPQAAWGVQVGSWLLLLAAWKCLLALLAGVHAAEGM
jgi:hypothetical protein